MTQKDRKVQSGMTSRKESKKQREELKKTMDDLRASFLVRKIEDILDYDIPNHDKVPIIMEKIKVWKNKK